MREQDDLLGVGMEKENNEIDILIEPAIWGLGRNLVLRKLPGIHKDDPS